MATKAKTTEVGREIKEATCRSCRTQLGLDGSADANQRLAALFILSITLGLRPGELRKLTRARQRLRLLINEPAAPTNVGQRPLDGRSPTRCESAC